MQSTLVGGSGAARLQGAKATLYVGGLSDNVNEAALHAAFIPFGEIKVNWNARNLGETPVLFRFFGALFLLPCAWRGNQERAAST